jgi:hypothetical protein
VRLMAISNFTASIFTSCFMDEDIFYLFHTGTILNGRKEVTQTSRKQCYLCDLEPRSISRPSATRTKS